ncbi:LOW QUALITY PROTEIN: hypothetical protein Cgig2_016578 [Carnegiea gigantea]|uniref:Peptidase A1 domain-containing protein n=1 Tax=Carnegiea gigantea TaxID=171969 RepID=A0A9Q1L0Q0_9CARY|nr:LOW QUALITY PROTEIN: hypothetical protein Cgig2_016578 [Carnegiea gigantea]
MASKSLLSFALIFTLSLFHFCQAGGVIPRRHGLTIIKDNVKNQYFTTFIVGSPPVTFTLLLDLGNLYSWIVMPTITNPPPSAPSLAAPPNAPPMVVAAVLAAMPSLVRAAPTTPVAPMPRLLGVIAFTRPLKGISANTKGVLTLGNVNIALHSVISKNFRLANKFALCLPTTDTILYKGFEGALYFGGGPYYMSKESRHDFSKSLVTTPLVVNPKSTAPISSEGDKSVEYFLNVKAIEVGGTPLKIDSSLLTINKNGVGGTKLSTLDPYTVLHRNIYKALVELFTAKAKAMNIPRVAPVAPFGACYDSRYMANTTSGPRVPTTDFVLDGRNARWRIYGANLMVKFFDIKYRNVLCLGFVDGGLKTTTSIVIGGKQMEDNIIEIDLESFRVGFTSAPVSLGLSCSQFQATLPTF